MGEERLINLGLIINHWHLDKKLREELKDKELFDGVTFGEFIDPGHRRKKHGNRYYKRS